MAHVKIGPSTVFVAPGVVLDLPQELLRLERDAAISLLLETPVECSNRTPLPAPLRDLLDVPGRQVLEGCGGQAVMVANTVPPPRPPLDFGRFDAIDGVCSRCGEPVTGCGADVDEAIASAEMWHFEATWCRGEPVDLSCQVAAHLPQRRDVLQAVALGLLPP